MIFFQQRCHCERGQRVKQSAKSEQSSVCFLAENSIITDILLKTKENRTRTWQITSLVALARNDSRLFEKFPKSLALAGARETDPSVETPISTTTRQTFVILAEDLQFIKNIVRTKRMEGDTEFTQKEALHHIIEFYRKNHE